MSAKAAAKKTAETSAKAGVAGASGFSATQQGAGVGSGAYEKAMSQPDAVWNRSPQFTARVQAGENPDDVKQSMALNVARQSAATAAAISGLTAGLLPATVEKALLGKKIEGNLLGRVAKGVAGEGIQEGAEEEYCVAEDIEDVWEMFWTDADKNGFTLEYGAEALYEHVRDWMIDRHIIDEVPEEEEEVDEDE